MELPSLRQKPSYRAILESLKSLKLKPSIWNDPAVLEVHGARGDAFTNSFLISVIMSKFEWLPEMKDDTGTVLSVDVQKEILIEEASSRMAERCGRSAAGEMTRTWVIPKSKALPEIQFIIREPALTGDRLGLKTWGTSFVLAKRLEFIGSKYLSPILKQTLDFHPKALELGAGTGLVGIAAAALWQTNVVLTDLEEIQENLIFNINKNHTTVTNLGGCISGDVLDWTNPHEALPSTQKKDFEIVIAADPMYDKEHPQLVAKMIKRFLKEGTESRALVAIPLRDVHTKRLAMLFSAILQSTGFIMVHQDYEACKDDWQSADKVQVQWTIWRRTDVDIYIEHDSPN